MRCVACPPPEKNTLGRLAYRLHTPRHCRLTPATPLPLAPVAPLRAHAFRIPRICYSSSSITTLPLILRPPPLQLTCTCSRPNPGRSASSQLSLRSTGQYHCIIRPAAPSAAPTNISRTLMLLFFFSLAQFAQFFFLFFLATVYVYYLSVCLCVCTSLHHPQHYWPPSSRHSHPASSTSGRVALSQGQASQAKSGQSQPPASSWDWHTAKLSLVSTSIHPHAESRPRRFELLTPPNSLPFPFIASPINPSWPVVNSPSAPVTIVTQAHRRLGFGSAPSQRFLLPPPPRRNSTCSRCKTCTLLATSSPNPSVHHASQPSLHLFYYKYFFFSFSLFIPQFAPSTACFGATAATSTYFVDPSGLALLWRIVQPDPFGPQLCSLVDQGKKSRARLVQVGCFRQH